MGELGGFLAEGLFEMGDGLLVGFCEIIELLFMLFSQLLAFLH